MPKDIRAFMARGEELGLAESVEFLRAVDATNVRRRSRVVELVRDVLGEDVVGAAVAVLGAAFKPNSDDIRDSPALDVAERLVALGVDVRVHDPEALAVARAQRPGPGYVDTVDEALVGARVVVLLTEWQVYRDLDPADVAEQVSGRVLIDGRNALDRQRWAEAGFTVHALGRPTITPAN